MNIIIDKIENDIKNIECLISNLQNILGEKWGILSKMTELQRKTLAYSMAHSREEQNTYIKV